MALPFSVDFQPGAPLTEQLVYAVKKAAISGLLKPGERFPSVRTLSQELRINPNTAHKATAALIADGILVVEPGIGTRMGEIPPGTEEERAQLLGAEAERLVVEAKALRLALPDLHNAVETHWRRLS
ncbi:MAG TPA: GntR family transcriptional regulator [Candidatus Methylacidiphilales bacterium]|nr:GntR family transcriptional regulator [Candidatus Methylacidiphilales bacterium]